jgi:predicted transcriptional regulator
MEVNLDILRAVQMGEEIPTKIMSKSNTTWKQLQQGLEFLEKNSFVRKLPVKNERFRRTDKRTRDKYRLTKRGESVLRYFKKEFEQVEVLFLSL